MARWFHGTDPETAECIIVSGSFRAGTWFAKDDAAPTGNAPEPSNAIILSLRSVANHERDHKGNSFIAEMLEMAATEIERISSVYAAPVPLQDKA
jgi:hypothetical protein